MAYPYKRFRELILAYYDRHRRQLPWRATKDPYHIWLSEVILQQTRVDQGLGYYLNFVQRFERVEDLAAAKIERIYKYWEGLGYYNRATKLHKTAQRIVREYGGKFPRSADELITLPGIGPYTAAAIASICYDEPIAVLDTNVVRVLSRVYGLQEDFGRAAGKKAFGQLADQLLDVHRPGDYNQGVMEFGALICRPKKPKCTQCSLNQYCRARILHLQEELPIKRKKIPKRHRFFYYFLICVGDHIIIRQRTHRDIWKGLYELPYIESDQVPSNTQIKRCLKSWGIHHYQDICASDLKYKQTLSHRYVHARFFELKAKNIRQNAGLYLINTKNLSTFAFPKLLNWFFKKKLLILE